MALTQTNDTLRCNVVRHLLSILVVATGFNIYFYVNILVQLAHEITPHSESIWFKIYSFAYQFSTDILTITIFCTWLTHTLYENTLSKGKQFRTTLGKSVNYVLMVTLSFFTMYLIHKKFELLLLATYKVGVLKQDPIYQRIFEYTYHLPEDGLSLVCTLGWLIFAILRIYQLKQS